jgi:saccharopine dehydrogenase-like NADP-dependent oxidoreductase
LKVAIIGVGMMGSAIAWDLARSADVDQIEVADVSQERLDSLKKRLGDRVSVTRVDVLDGAKLRRFLEDCDVAVSALPHGTVHPADVAAVQAGAKLVNIAFEDEQMALDGRARRSGATLVPGCGVAPGLSSILVAEGARRLDAASEGHIFVGGLPQKPLPPLSYRLVFSVKGLVREYLTARVISNGKITSVHPFGDVQRVRFPKLGTLEAFLTDGLGSSLFTLTRLKELDERTLRWPGHADKIKFLIDAGFFSDEKVTVDGAKVSPIDVSSAVLQKILTRGGPEDLTVMRVEVVGTSRGRKAKVVFDLLDYYDETNGITSMGRTTGFTAAIVARMLGRGDLSGTGVLAPEVALDERCVKRLISELASKGVELRSSLKMFA